MAEKTYAGKDAEIERDQDQAEEAQEGLVERMDEAITRLSWARDRATTWHISDAVGAIGDVLTMLKVIVDKRRQDTVEKAMECKVVGVSAKTVKTTARVLCWGCMGTIPAGTTVLREYIAVKSMGVPDAEIHWCRSCAIVRMDKADELKRRGPLERGVILHEFTREWHRAELDFTSAALDTERLERPDKSEQSKLTDYQKLSERIFSVRSALNRDDSHTSVVMVWDVVDRPDALFFVQQGRLFFARYVHVDEDEHGKTGVPDGYARYDWSQVEQTFVPEAVEREGVPKAKDMAPLVATSGLWIPVYDVERQEWTWHEAKAVTCGGESDES